MHAAEREKIILDLLAQRKFITFKDIETHLDASPATLRRDLIRLEKDGLIDRVRGGAKLPANNSAGKGFSGTDHLTGVPFHENIGLMREEKEAIGRMAASLCEPGTSVMIDGGSTTLQMCPHLENKNLQVFTNSLHIVSALLPQKQTRLLVPGGTVFREQNIILSVPGDESIPRFYAPELFMGAAAIGPKGLMQDDVILVATERRLIEMAEELVVLADHTKFHESSGNVVCSLDVIDVVVTDAGISAEHVAMLEKAGVRVVIAKTEGD